MVPSVGRRSVPGAGSSRKALGKLSGGQESESGWRAPCQPARAGVRPSWWASLEPWRASLELPERPLAWVLGEEVQRGSL